MHTCIYAYMQWTARTFGDRSGRSAILNTCWSPLRTTPFSSSSCTTKSSQRALTTHVKGGGNATRYREVCSDTDVFFTVWIWVMLNNASGVAWISRSAKQRVHTLMSPEDMSPHRAAHTQHVWSSPDESSKVIRTRKTLLKSTRLWNMFLRDMHLFIPGTWLHETQHATVHLFCWFVWLSHPSDSCTALRS